MASIFVSASWFTLFHNDQSLQFIVTNQGPVATTVPHWTDRVYLSLDN